MNAALDKTKNTASISDATLLNILMKSLPDTIYFKDTEGRFIRVNEQQSKILGVASPTEAIGKTDYNFFPESFAEEAHQDEVNIMASDTPLKSKLEKLIGHDGQVKWLSATKAPIHDDLGNTIGIVGLSRDVTERQKLEEQIVELNNLRELLLDIITHDLRNPAGVILSLSGLAIQESPQDKKLQVIHSTSKSLLDVLNSTTILSQAAFGEKIPMESMDLLKLVTSIAEEFALALTQAEMELEMEIPGSIEIQANPLLGEVFKNFISNAIKYANDGGKIIIQAEKQNHEILIKVIDWGNTIPEIAREEIFQRRTQFGGEKKHGRGRGLGLAIVKRIAAAHHGNVWVEPNHPSGNIFCLRIPG